MLHLVLFQCVIWLSGALELKSPIYSKNTHITQTQTLTFICKHHLNWGPSVPDSSGRQRARPDQSLLLVVEWNFIQMTSILLDFPLSSQCNCCLRLLAPLASCKLLLTKTSGHHRIHVPYLQSKHEALFTPCDGTSTHEASSCGPKPVDRLWSACTWFVTTHLRS